VTIGGKRSMNLGIAIENRAAEPPATSVKDSANDPTKNLSGMSAWASTIATRRHLTVRARKIIAGNSGIPEQLW